MEGRLFMLPFLWRRLTQKSEQGKDAAVFF